MFKNLYFFKPHILTPENAHKTLNILNKPSQQYPHLTDIIFVTRGQDKRNTFISEGISNFSVCYVMIQWQSVT